MLEFTISIIFVFLVIGAVLDLALGLYEYTYLHYTTTRAAREISARLATSKDCDTISRYLIDRAHVEMSNAFGGGKDAAWDYCFVSVGNPACLKNTDPNPTFKSLQLSASMPLTCFFLCSVLPKDWHVTTTVSSNLETPSLKCPKGRAP
ncbi:MAG: hypothetical protein U0136_18085 [Bdellovibrionota bacterium]